MKYVGRLMLLLVLCLNAYALDYEKLVKGIEGEAIVIGEGGNRVYAFLDPLCPKSRNYLETVTESTHLHKRNTYYLFLYRLQKYRSDKLISYIYDADNPRAMMEQVMLKDFEPMLGCFVASPAAMKRKKTISETADRFNAERRPYILLFKEGSAFCRVSEGTAPCLEERQP